MKRLWIKNEDGLVDVFNVRKHVLDYKPEGFDEKTPLGPRYIEVMRVEDHERVVAQKDAEIERLKRERAKYEADCKRIEYFDDLHEKVATQKRVIEKLKEQRDIELEDNCWDDALTGGRPFEQTRAMMDAEIEAIEKGP